MADQGIRRRARWETTRDALAQRREDISGWLEKRRAADVDKQYDTQLRQIEGLLIRALDDLASRFEAVDDTGPVEEVYDDCHLFDRRLAWLGRVWEFFRLKFDQRDDESYAPTLAAADELVWSCFQPCFTGSTGNRPPAVPLPFIELSYAPEAFPPELVPSSLRGADIDLEFLREHLNRLPIGVVRMPPVGTSPWSLALLAHEVGHQVQHALEPNHGLVSGFRNLVQETVAAAGESPEDAQRWGGWSQELFADAFWAHTMGQWALWGLVELELRRPEAMAVARVGYPAPVVRLAFMEAVVSSLGLETSAVLRGFSPQGARSSPEAARDLDLVPFVVKATMGALPGPGQTLVELTRFQAAEFGPGGVVAVLADRLLQRGNGTVNRGIRAPRLIAAALVAAFHELLDGPQDRLASKASVGEAALALMRDRRPDGVRAVQAGIVPAEGPGSELAELLMAADRRTLER